MTSGVCKDEELFALSSSCARNFWGAVVPAVFTAGAILTTIPVPAPVQKVINVVKSPFRNFLTLHEAQALDAGEESRAGEDSQETTPVPLWRSLLLAGIALVEALVWLGVGSYTVVVHPDEPWNSVPPFLIAFSWLYAITRPIVSPTATPPYDLFALYTLHLVSSILTFGGVLFDHNVSGLPSPSPLALTAYIANLTAVAILMLVVLNMPVDVPNGSVKKEDIVNFTVKPSHG